MVCDAVSTPIKTTLYTESRFTRGYFESIPFYDAGVGSTDP